MKKLCSQRVSDTVQYIANRTIHQVVLIHAHLHCYPHAIVLYLTLHMNRKRAARLFDELSMDLERQTSTTVRDNNTHNNNDNDDLSNIGAPDKRGYRSIVLPPNERKHIRRNLAIDVTECEPNPSMSHLSSVHTSVSDNEQPCTNEPIRSRSLLAHARSIAAADAQTPKVTLHVGVDATLASSNYRSLIRR